MERAFLAAECFISNQQVIISTVHLESLDNTDMRIQQMKEIYGFLKDFQICFLMGDMNFGDEFTNEQNAIQPRFKDLWKLQSSDPGYTRCKPEKKPQRFDRIFMTENPMFQIAEMEVIGKNEVLKKYEECVDKTPNEDGIYKTASDHFGVYARLTINKEQ